MATAGALSLRGDEPAYVEGEVLVRFHAGSSKRQSDDILASSGLAVRRHYRWLSERSGRRQVLVRHASKSTATLLAELGRDPAVETAEPNYLRYPSASASALPVDARFGELWGLHNTGQSVNGVTGTADVDIDFPEAWAMARPNPPEVVIGIIDTGVDYTHPDLAANMWTNPGETPNNSTDDDGNGFVDDYYGYDFAGDNGAAPDPDPMDIDTSPGHGTHVSGTAAAVRNSEGIAGVNYKARVMALKASESGTTLPASYTMAAIEYATMMKTRGVNVVALNGSYGGPGFSVLEQAAIVAAGQAGIIFVAAAGNETANNDSTSFYPANYNAANIISVAATGPSDTLADFSNFGATTVDLAAPGDDILSTIPAHVSTDASVVSPATTYTSQGMQFAGRTDGITATVYDCGLGYPSNFPAQVNGNIALIERGTLFFTEKAQNAMAAGAVAAIIYNHSPGLINGTLQVPSNWMPVVELSQTDGQLLRAEGNVQVTVTHALNPNNAYLFLGGTSMAAPHVAGAVALMAMNYPLESVAQRINRILSNVDPVAALSGKVASGGRLNIARAIDTDGDTLPDWWELQTALSLGTMNASSDTDQDGALDAEEFLAGTNAGDENSNLALQTPGAPDANGVVIRWTSASNRTYRVMRTTDLSVPFSALASGIRAVPPMNTYTDATAVAASRIFYRIELE